MVENKSNEENQPTGNEANESNQTQLKLDPRNPKEALAILDRATAALSGPRQAHLAVIQALQTLAASIKELEEVKQKS